MRVFFDTNVLIDVLARREPHYADSAILWTMAEQGHVVGLIAAVSVTNIYDIVRRLRDESAARAALVTLRDTFEVVSCSGQIINQAIDSAMGDFEDAVQLFSALHARADVVATRNPDHFQRSGAQIAIATPSAFLATWSDDGSDQTGGPA